MRTLHFLALALGICASAEFAYADRTDDLVEKLREQGRIDGWTFEVGRTSMLDEPIDDNPCFKRRPDWDRLAPFVVPPDVRDLPAHFDWREKGVVGPIRDQAQPVYCGSCWAHGTTAAFEGAVAIKTGFLPNIGPQQLVSCEPSYGTCNGGDFAFGFYEKVGANYEIDFPYVARDVACKVDAPRHEMAASWGYVGAQDREPTTEELKNAIYTYGPIAVTVSSTVSWRAYSGGVYNACDGININHIVAIVGWDDAEQSWIVKNSHGTSWGEQGYMRSKWIGKNGKKCNGIGGSAAWVILAQ